MRRAHRRLRHHGILDGRATHPPGARRGDRRSRTAGTWQHGGEDSQGGIAAGASELQVRRCPQVSACHRIDLQKIKGWHERSQAGTVQRVALRDAVVTSGPEVRPCLNPGVHMVAANDVEIGPLLASWRPEPQWTGRGRTAPSRSGIARVAVIHRRVRIGLLRWRPCFLTSVGVSDRPCQRRRKRRQRRQQRHGFAPAARLTSPDRLLAYK